jgi:sarcosine oxidase subunit beta
MIAHDEPHPLIMPFSLDRFRQLDFVLESGTTTAR